MLTEVTFTVNSRTGNLIRLLAATRRLGFKTIDQRMQKTTETAVDYIEMILESDHQIVAKELTQISALVPTVVEINLGMSQSAETSPSFDESAYVAAESQKLVAIYPNILRHLHKMETEIPATNREDVLLQLGDAIGQWRHQKTHLYGTRLPLDKAVQRSLKAALSEFLKVTANQTTIYVNNCPQCAIHHTTATQDCFFITGFIQGYMSKMGFLGNLTVQQKRSMAAGASACEFVVSL